MKKLFFFAALLALALTAKAQDVVFVVHRDLTETTLSAEDVKNILLGNLTKWPKGPVIKLVILTEGPVQTKVIRDHTQRTPDQFDKFWKRKVFTGTGIMPAQVQTEAEVIAYVAANPGAIGYVSKPNASEKVRILPVN